MDKHDGDRRKLAFRINEHISKCDDCFKSYDAIQKLGEQVDLLVLSEFSDEKAALLEALLLKSDTAQRDRISEWIKKLCKCTSEISFKIISKADIRIGNSNMGGNAFAFDFGHPLPVGARGGSAGAGSAAKLVDNENELNRIELSGSGTVRAQLDPNDYSTSPLAVLIGSSGEAHISEMKEDAGVISCEFENLPPGEYRLYVE
jgi:hypothetical protein